MNKLLYLSLLLVFTGFMLNAQDQITAAPTKVDAEKNEKKQKNIFLDIDGAANGSLASFILAFVYSFKVFYYSFYAFRFASVTKGRS